MRRYGKKTAALLLALLLLLAILPCGVPAAEAQENGLTEPSLPEMPANPAAEADRLPPGTTPRPADGGLPRRSGAKASLTERQRVSDQILENFLTASAEMGPEMFLWNDEYFFLRRYRHEEQANLDYTEEMRSAITLLAEDITADCATDAERIEAVAYWVAGNVGYDYDYYTHQSKSYPDIDPYTVLEKRYTVCAGYSSTCEYLLQCLGIPCVTAVSLDHDYNIAYDGERWVIFDATWMTNGRYEYGELTFSGDISSFWYDVSYEDTIRFELNHIIGGMPYTVCDGTLVGYPRFTPLPEVFFDGSVTSIGDNAFTACSCLTEAVIPAGVTSIGDWAFSACTGLQSVTVQGDLSSIGLAAFTGDSALEDFTLLGSVGSIGDWAFQDCSGLTGEITLDQLSSLGNGAFAKTPLTAVNITGSGLTINRAAFSECASLATLNVQGTVRSIGDNAFYRCGSLSGSVSFPGELDSIGSYAFYGCASLTGLSFPGSVRSVADHAFFDCGGLTGDVTLNGLSSLGDGAFCYCRNLASVTLRGTLTCIGTNTFSYCRKMIAVTVPKSVTVIGNNAFNYCDALRHVYYDGSDEDWEQIEVGVSNNALRNVLIHYALQVTGLKVVPDEACAGDALTWSVGTLGGSGALQYRFYVYKDGSIVKKGSYTASDSYTYVPGEAGVYRVKVYVRDGEGTVVTRSGGSVTVGPAALAITAEPEDYRGPLGSAASFTVGARGEGLSYQWYVKKPTAAKFSRSSITGPTYAVTLTEERDGNQVYCVVTDAYGGSAQTNTVSMTVALPLSVTAGLQDYRGPAGSTASF
ncbi:MAG: leucine-rich repeat protein, partial [Oscillospiraceae bacterium]|nr:leucine-rich repeat protein [Oscillospiraceae bacterium]